MGLSDRTSELAHCLMCGGLHEGLHCDAPRQSAEEYDRRFGPSPPMWRDVSGGLHVAGDAGNAARGRRALGGTVAETPPAPGDVESPAPVRKDYPLARGLLRMFPNALAAVAHCSLVGSRQHGLEPGEWDRSRSVDHEDALLRHLMDAGHHDSDGVRHAAKVAWRALALLQLEIEASR